MSRQIVYAREVTGDFVEAYRYYETIAGGLGDKFEMAYYQAEAEIEAGILTHRALFGDYRRVVVRKFPYVVYYRLDGPRAVILGLFFAKRDPEAIKQSLQSRKE